MILEGLRGVESFSYETSFNWGDSIGEQEIVPRPNITIPVTDLTSISSLKLSITDNEGNPIEGIVVEYSGANVFDNIGQSYDIEYNDEGDGHYSNIEEVTVVDGRHIVKLTLGLEKEMLPDSETFGAWFLFQ